MRSARWLPPVPAGHGTSGILLAAVENSTPAFVSEALDEPPFAQKRSKSYVGAKPAWRAVSLALRDPCADLNGLLQSLCIP